jgi:hypothetical protein
MTLLQQFIFLGEGRGRLVYKHKNWVIKIPKDDWGLGDNYHEATVSKIYKNRPNGNGVYFAKCKITPCGLLVMEYVDTTSINYKTLPEWTGFVDCNQVGLTKDGRLVAYDYGIS